MNYVKKYKIAESKLKQQYIFELSSTSVETFPEWLEGRAKNLASAANQFLEKMRDGLNLPAVVGQIETDSELMEAAE